VSESLALVRARRALEVAGLPPDSPRRAPSATNEVWLTDEHVVRVNRRPSPRLRREAILAPHLPVEAGYPSVLAYGGELGADWLIVERVPGDMLARCWPHLSREERRSATRQVAEVLRHVHAVHCPDDLPDTDNTPQPLDPHQFPAVSPVLAIVAHLRSLPGVDRTLLAEVTALVTETASVIEPFDVPTLVHGDLHFQNVLWDGSVVTALLDFEWARAAPPDLDLDVFLRFCAHPDWHVAPDYRDLTKSSDYADVPYWFAEDYPELFDRPFLFERLRLYGLAYDVRDLAAEVRTAGPSAAARGPHPPWHPYTRLEHALQGRSHLDVLRGAKVESFEDSP